MDPVSPESTALLLQRIRAGDDSARDRLLERYLPILRRWAHGRMPAKSRGLADTDDLVQITLVRVLKQLERFEPRHEGAFLAYLRRILINAMRNEMARAATRGQQVEIGEGMVASGPSPLESVLGRDMLDRYEAAFALLGEEQQEAVLMRVELGLTYDEIAEAMGKNSANTARMIVARGLARLAETMEEPRGGNAL